jgi:hypothetical protein
MLLHNYTAVRTATAEVLILVLNEKEVLEILLKEDWSKTKPELKHSVDKFPVAFS